uniref:glutathione transferase n=1 Tax=Oreochromis aureus TaxID=47969 RepID=A0AAZ1X4Y8_OREAU
MATGRLVEVYLDLLSQPCRAVHILLTCTKIPHRVRTMALRKGEHRTLDFTKLNPMQKVPVMVDDGFVLTESDAILKYLATKYDVPEHWYPRQPERRARVDEYTAWHHTNTRPHAAKVFILEVLLPAQSGSLVDEARLNRALSDLDDTLDKLESMFLRRQPFLCGDDITVADLLAACELTQCVSLQPLGGGRDVLKERPQLQRWRSRVQSAVGEAFDKAHGVLYALRDRRRARL